ncbi:MAG: O-methyltransferase [Bacilli bacterium]|nr:O-methyltransferase [Bacilli bacterium]
MDMVEEKLHNIEEYAKKFNIPIIQKEGIEFLEQFIKEHNIEKILEIGTAIGYSSIKMALISKKMRITSIERDEERYQEALKNINSFSLQDRINTILGDALTLDLSEKYDLIFIDAAKAQNKKLFLKYEKNLREDGYIITDNLYFHGYVFRKMEEIESKNIRGLVRKIKEYTEFLQNNKEYETKFYSLGDGISISKRI